MTNTMSWAAAICKRPVVLRTPTQGTADPGADGVRPRTRSPLEPAALSLVRVASRSAELRSAPATNLRSPARSLVATQREESASDSLPGLRKPLLTPCSSKSLPVARRLRLLSPACGLRSRCARFSTGRFQSAANFRSPLDRTSVPAWTRIRAWMSGCVAPRRDAIHSAPPPCLPSTKSWFSA